MKTIFLSQIEPKRQNLFEAELFQRANFTGEAIFLLYGWNGNVISTGKLQKILRFNTKKCGDDGVKIIKRLTGGRAVFHSNDICFSLFIPQVKVCKIGKNLEEAIGEISIPIINTLAEFGIKADLQSKSARNVRSDFCAQTSGIGEISVNGKKLVASSQIYSENGILQQTTIPITADYRRICDYFEGDNDATRKYMQENTTCLDEICKDFDEVIFLQRLSQNFCEWQAGI